MMIMKRRTLAIATAGICTALLFSTATVDRAYAAEKVINLKIANFFPPPSKQSKITQEFGEELERRSEGRIKVQYFAGGSLLTGPAMFKGIETGIADVGYSHVYYTPGRMPVSEGLGLPVGTPTGWVGGPAGNDFYEKYRPKEVGGGKGVPRHPTGPGR